MQKGLSKMTITVNNCKHNGEKGPLSAFIFFANAHLAFILFVSPLLASLFTHLTYLFAQSASILSRITLKHSALHIPIIILSIIYLLSRLRAGARTFNLEGGGTIVNAAVGQRLHADSSLSLHELTTVCSGLPFCIFIKQTPLK